MVHAKNYETMFTFVKVLQKKLGPLFFRTRCMSNVEIVRNCQSYSGFNLPSEQWSNRAKRFDVKYTTCSW